MMEPIKLLGVTRSPIWGGTRLPLEWGKGTELSTVGESWELTLRTDGECRAVGGKFDGMPLSEIIRANREGVMGKSKGSESDFPLLVKLIDAQAPLSVQVHPDDAYASRVENDRGKTEMWYIVDAEEGAEIICGLGEGIDTAAFAEAVKENRTEEALCKIPVKRGDCFFIPAGLAHAIGKGILIAEIQQNCDLTYRVYDYNRLDKNGLPRELHVKKALDVIRPFSASEIEQLRYECAKTEHGTDLLADCVYFRVERISPTEKEVRLSGEGRMGHLLCIAGEGILVSDGKEMTVARGESILLPAACQNVTVSGDCELLYSLAY